MRILPGYVFREITGFFLLCLGVFTGILVTARMLKLTSLVINKGVDLSRVVLILSSIVPTFLEVALPMSVLLGVILAFGRLSADSEIIVIRASGVSLKQLLYTVFSFGMFVASINLIVSVYLRPWGYSTLATTLFQIASSSSTAGLTGGVFNRLGKIMIYAEEIDHESGGLTRVLIDDRRDDSNRQIIVSKTGMILSDEKKRTINLLLRDGSIHSSPDSESYNITGFARNRISVDPYELSNTSDRRGRRTRELSLKELNSEEAYYQSLASDLDAQLSAVPHDIRTGEEENNEGAVLLKALKSKHKEALERITDIKIEVVRKFSMPVACLIMALLAMPLGIQPARSHNSLGATLSLMLGLSIIIFYYGLQSVGLTLAKSGTVSPAVGLWIPNLIFAAIAIVALRKMGSEKWQTVVHGIEVIIGKASRKLGLGKDL